MIEIFLWVAVLIIVWWLVDWTKQATPLEYAMSKKDYRWAKRTGVKMKGKR